MASRACLCGVVNCAKHRQSRKPRHPGAYGADHQEQRRRLLASSPEICWRCGEGPRLGDPWEAGHITDVAVHGPNLELRREHRSCNRRAGAQLGAELRKKRADKAAERRIAETYRYLDGAVG
jgi:hypothetical protein